MGAQQKKEGYALKTISIPLHSNIISFGVDYSDSPCIWVLQKPLPNQEMREVIFKIAVTGAEFELSSNDIHQATINVKGYIYHIFECKK